MNDLRFILIAIGMLFIAAIYLYGTKKKLNISKLMQKHIKRRNNKKTIVQKRPRTPVIKGKINPKTLVDGNIYKNEPRLSSKTAAKKTKTQHKHGDMQPEIISLLIKPADNEEFLGTDILTTLESASFQFGDMDIFHYMIELKTGYVTIFSLADMYEPGYFNLANMETYKGKGLALFMRLPTPIDDLLAFEMMKESASRLATTLNGDIYTAEHQIISEAILTAMRITISESTSGN